MGVIDDFKQEKNKMVINVATEKMIMDKCATKKDVYGEEY